LRISITETWGKVLIPLTGIVTYLTYILMLGLYIGYLSSMHTWLLYADESWQSLAARALWLLEFLIIAGPLCVGFGMAFGYSCKQAEKHSGIAIGLAFIVTEWAHSALLLGSFSEKNIAIILYDIPQYILVVLLFWIAVRAGKAIRMNADKKKPSSFSHH